MSRITDEEFQSYIDRTNSLVGSQPSPASMGGTLGGIASRSATQRKPFYLPEEDSDAGGLDNALGRGVGNLKSAIGAVAYEAGAEDFGVDLIKSGQQQIRDNPMNAEEMAFQRNQQQEDFGGSLWNLITNPDMAANAIVESAPLMPINIAGAVAGGALGSLASPVGGAVGAAAGAGLGSFLTEYGNSLIQTFEENGVDVRNEAQLRAAFGNRELMSEARRFGVTRGIPIAVFDAASLGIGGKIYGPAAAKIMGLSSRPRKVVDKFIAPVGGATAELGVQAAAGGAGEAGAQLLSEGRITDPSAIATEMVAEFGTGGPEVIAAPYLRREKTLGRSTPEPEVPPIDDMLRGVTPQYALPPPLDVPPGGPPEPGRTGRTGLEPTPRTAPPRQLEDRSRTIDVTPEGVALPREEALRRANSRPADDTIRVTPSGTAILPDSAQTTTSGVLLQPGAAPERTARTQAERERQFAQEQTSAGPAMAAGRANLQGQLADDIDQQEAADRLRNRQNIKPEEVATDAKLHDTLLAQYQKLEQQRTQLEAESRQFQEQASAGNKQAKARLKSLGKKIDDIDARMSSAFDQIVDIRDKYGTAPEAPLAPMAAAEPAQKKSEQQVNEQGQPDEAALDESVGDQTTPDEYQAKLFSLFRAFDYLKTNFPDAVPADADQRLTAAFNATDKEEAIADTDALLYETESAIQMAPSEIWGGFKETSSGSKKVQSTPANIRDAGPAQETRRGKPDFWVPQVTAVERENGRWDFQALSGTGDRVIFESSQTGKFKSRMAALDFGKGEARNYGRRQAERMRQNELWQNFPVQAARESSEGQNTARPAVRPMPAPVAAQQQTAPADPQTQTKKFKNWFRRSKAVTPDGQPLQLYHTTTTDFRVFSRPGQGTNTQEARTTGGALVGNRDMVFLTPDRTVANDYSKIKTVDQNWNVSFETEDGANIMPVYASIQRPKIINGRGRSWYWTNQEALDAYDSGRYDGVIIKDVIDNFSGEAAGVKPADVYVAFGSNRVKSSTGNNGNFDPINPDITETRRPQAGRPASASGAGYMPNVTSEYDNTSFEMPVSSAAANDAEIAEAGNLIAGKTNSVTPDSSGRQSRQIYRDPRTGDAVNVGTGSSKIEEDSALFEALSFVWKDVSSSIEGMIGFNPASIVKAIVSHNSRRGPNTAQMTMSTDTGDLTSMFLSVDRNEFANTRNPTVSRKLRSMLAHEFGHVIAGDGAYIKKTIDLHLSKLSGLVSRKSLAARKAYSERHTDLAAIDPELFVDDKAITVNKTIVPIDGVGTVTVEVKSMDTDKMSPVMREIFTKYLNDLSRNPDGSSQLIAEFRYPIDVYLMDIGYKTGLNSTTPTEEGGAFLSSEIYAQLSALYFTQPKALKAALPVAFKYIERKAKFYANNRIQSEGAGTRRDSSVQREVRSQRTERGPFREDSPRDAAGSPAVAGQGGAEPGVEAGVGGAAGATNEGISNQAQQSNRSFRLDINRAERVVDQNSGLSAAEIDAVEASIQRLSIPREVADRLIENAIATKRRHPVENGWAETRLLGLRVPEGKQPSDAVLNWQQIPYKYNVPGGTGRAPLRRDQAWASQVADRVFNIVNDIYQRSEAGDRNAQTIVGHSAWYRNVTEVLRREFGAAGDLLADLLGATSPNTAVDQNWNFSIDIMRRFVRGEFDVELRKLADFITEGGQISDYPAQDKIRQISGKLYGMNSGGAMLALLNTWRQVRPGAAPKARNFALNLIGQSELATIDVWAARLLRRAANDILGNLPRIPPAAETGVSGNWNASGSEITGEFGFGADVFEQVANRLRQQGRDITAPDLQAVAWFAEKELWARNNWTTVAGEGGSFEEAIASMPMERLLAGWSIQQGERIPNPDTASAAQARVMATLARDGSVISARVLPTKGLYGGVVEESFDTEWTVEKGKHDPSLVLAEIAKIAKDNSQYDIFVSKVLSPDDSTANARPGVEIYFKNQKAMNDVMPLLEEFTSRGVDGFTLAVDPRSSSSNYIGVRLQYVPEISMRWDSDFRQAAAQPGFIEQEIESKRRQLEGIVANIAGNDGVAFAKVYDYDTIVVGKENYDEIIDRATSRNDSATGGQSWFGQPIREAIERAAARLAGEQVEADTGGVPDAGSAVRETAGQQEEVRATGPPIRDASPGQNTQRPPRFGRPPQQPQSRFDRWLNNARRTAQNITTPPPPVQPGVETKTDRLQRKLQDKYLRLKRYEQQVADERGWARLPDWMSAYRREEVMHGKVSSDLDRIDKMYIEPMSKVMQENDITVEELGLFVYAKHAEERNENIRQMRDQLPPDQRMDDGGSGMTNEDANAILDAVDRLGLTAKMEEAAQYVYDMLEDGRSRLEKAGLEDPMVVGAWRAAYDFYVPLKGFASDEILMDGESRVSIGRGLSVGGRESFRALGRKMEAYNPVATAVRDVGAKIIRARKNEVGKAFLSFVRANPKPALWQVIDGSQIEKYFNESTGKVEYRPVNPMTLKFRSENVFEVKRGGQTEYILLKDELLAAAMMNVGENQINEMGGLILSTFGRVSNWIAGVNTRWNPVWTAANAPRDFTAGLLNLAAEADLNNGLLNGQQIAKDVAADVLTGKPHRAYWSVLRGKTVTDPEALQYQQYAQEFLDDGGATGWVRFRTADEELARLEKMASRKLSGPSIAMSAARTVVDFLEHTNDTVENALRLSAYRHAREAGLPRSRAASLAKNMTINFNRKGEMNTVLNGLYMFWNASIQGSAQVVRTLSSRKAQKIMAGIAATHAALAVYNMVAMEGDDEDYEKIPEYLKKTNLLMYVNGKLITLPLPYGYSAFSYGATKVAELLMGKATAGDAASGIAGKLVDDFLPIRIPEGDFKLLRAVAPTGFQWAADLAANQNYFGGTIRNTQFPGQTTPDSSMGRRSTHPLFHALAKGLNRATGGTDNVSGAIDLNPDNIKYFMEFIGGGAARTTFSSLDFATDPTDVFDAPFVSKLVRDLGAREYSRMYYEQIDELKQIQAESKSRKGGAKLEWDKEHRGELETARLITSYETRLRALRKRRNSIEDSNQPDNIKDQQLEKVEEQIAGVYEEFVKRSRNIRGN